MKVINWWFQHEVLNYGIHTKCKLGCFLYIIFAKWWFFYYQFMLICIVSSWRWCHLPTTEHDIYVHTSLEIDVIHWVTDSMRSVTWWSEWYVNMDLVHGYCIYRCLYITIIKCTWHFLTTVYSWHEWSSSVNK